MMPRWPGPHAHPLPLAASPLPCPPSPPPLPAPPLCPPGPPRRRSQPCIIFVGEKFESVPALKLARSLLLDMFRGEQIEKVNLAGIDRVLMAGRLRRALCGCAWVHYESTGMLAADCWKQNSMPCPVLCGSATKYLPCPALPCLVCERHHAAACWPCARLPVHASCLAAARTKRTLQPAAHRL